MSQQPRKQVNQRIDGTYDGFPVGIATTSSICRSLQMDPLDCAKKVSAINAMQLQQLMPLQKFNCCFWPQSYPSSSTSSSFITTSPWTGQQLYQPNYLTPMVPVLPIPASYPFLMGVTCEGVPVKKRRVVAPGEVSMDKMDCGMSLVSELSLGTTLDNSCSILSSDSYENFDTIIESDRFCHESYENFDKLIESDRFCHDSFDLFSSDFDAFIDRLENSSDSFHESDQQVLKLHVPFLEPHVEIPRKRRTTRIKKKKALSKKRIRAFRSLIR